MISNIESQSDVATLISIFSEVWGAETLSEFVNNIQSNLCILSKNTNSKVTGYLFYDYDRREDFIEITDLGVAYEYQGQGYGKELVDYICKQSACVRLSVRTDNDIAKNLYTVLGFKEIHIVQNYYGVGSDGMRMEWKKDD